MKKGFTLIEMLIVVLIIGILAAIALPRYQLAVKKTKIMKAAEVLPTIFSALDRYRLANGSFPVISDATGPAAVAELNDALDIDIPNLNGFNLVYYTSYVGYFNNEGLYILAEWRIPSLRNARSYMILCDMVASSINDDKKKICAAVCGHDNFFYYADAYGCAVNNPGFSG